MHCLHRRVVPRLRPEADGARYLAWAGDILTSRRAQLIHAYYGPVGWRMLALKRRLRVPLVVSFLGDAKRYHDADREAPALEARYLSLVEESTAR